MVTSTTAPAARSAASPWPAALYAGLFTALAGVVVALLMQANTGWLWVASILLIGVGPVLGYQLATGRLGSDWRSIVGGLIGGFPLLGVILWPLITGAMTRNQRIGFLYLWHIVGLILAVLVFWVLGLIMGQNPSWVGFGSVMAFSVWGGTVGAAMASQRLPFDK